MHGIFVGEIQALEGAGRTCWTSRSARERRGHGEVPSSSSSTWPASAGTRPATSRSPGSAATWARRVLGEHLPLRGRLQPRSVLRLTGVNRALEGLAIDVFNTMREFGDIGGDPVLEFCEDWMLADEVTHVKMGSDWLRRLTATDRSARSGRSSSSAWSTSSSPSVASGARRTTPRAPRLAASQLAGFPAKEEMDIAEIAAKPRGGGRSRPTSWWPTRPDGPSRSGPRASPWCSSTPARSGHRRDDHDGDRPRRRRHHRGRRDDADGPRRGRLD